MTIMMTFFLVAAALLLLLTVWQLRGHAKVITSLDDLQGLTRPIDVAAFRNLVHPDEELFLREKLSPVDFREVHQLRMRAALEYLHRVAHNASLLLRLGESLRNQEEADVQLIASAIVKNAVMVRLLALLAMTSISINMYFPGIRLPVRSVLASYQQLSDNVRGLCSHTAPARVGEILSLL